MAAPRSPENRLVRAGEAARILRVGPTTMQRWIDAGHVPAHRTLGGHRRIWLEDLLAFARDNGIVVPGTEGRAVEMCDVLLIDDEPDFLETLRVRVSGLRPDLHVVTAATGFAGGYCAARLVPRLVLLDIRMPGIDGIEICRMIREDPRTRDTRIVGLTASRDEAEISALVAAGAEQVLFKPVDPDVLAGVLEVLPAPA